MIRTVLLALAALLATAPAGAADLIVTRATLWTDQGPRANREILIRDGRVAKVARAGTLKPVSGARIIDAAGDTLLPGLIDAHVHLVSGVRLPKEFTAAERARVAARQLLKSGVTSGRIHLWDLPTATAFIGETKNSGYPSPRFQLGGPGIFGGQPDWYADGGNGWGVKSADDAAVKLQRLREAGVSWVTLHDLPRFLPGEAEAIVETAHGLGLRVGAAGDNLESIERALALGVDSIEYLDRGEAPGYSPELIERMRAQKQRLYLVPAIGFPYRFVAYRTGRMALDAPRLTEFMPATVAEFASAVLRDDRTQPIQYAPTYTDVPAGMRVKFRQLVDAHLKVVTGTDCGSPAHIQADAIWWELETWRHLGVPLKDIVRAATRLPAELLGDPHAGHLGVGAYGDFVLYRGALSDGPLSIERVRSVAKDGTLFLDEGRWTGSSGAD
jgi:imidazolonepropionase-like amidohydrolase